MEKIIVENERCVINCLTEEISKCAKSALAERGVFRVGLSGKFFSKTFQTTP